ncbi:ABC transporter ATP-binding protein [Neisseriaceae bacterium ESL0693]|nr:ABC transporter ATP-binding protein [Neisseriaceae bacterium ESL0693]
MLLQTDSLAIGYHQKIIARNINLSLPAGQIIGLLGSNGAGKSTFFKTILHLLPPIEGNIRLAGRDSGGFTPAERVALVGYVPQAQQCSAPFMVSDFVMMGRAAQIGLFRQPSAEDEATCDAYLKLLNISHLRQRWLSQLSGGEQQLVLIARTLAQQSKLLLMDEPTSSLDFKNQVRVLDSINELKQRGYTIIFSSHQPNQIAQVADMLLLLDQKTITQIEEPQRFITADNMARLYQLNAIQVHKYMGI